MGRISAILGIFLRWTTLSNGEMQEKARNSCDMSCFFEIKLIGLIQELRNRHPRKVNACQEKGGNNYEFHRTYDFINEEKRR